MSPRPVVSHTPGPWQRDESDLVIRAGKVFVCDLDAEGIALSFPEIGEAEANARLIASAPALLEALRQIVEYHDSGRTETRWTAKDGIAEAGSLVNLDFARAVLTQATGKDGAK